MDKDQTTVNKIEMSATQSTPKAMENTISFADAAQSYSFIINLIYVVSILKPFNYYPIPNLPFSISV